MRDGLILVQGAMDVETEWLTAQLEAPEETALGEFPFWRGSCRGRELVVSRTGVGMVRAAAATALGIQRFAPALVVNQGIAGAHREDLHVGDIVVGRTCVPIHQVQMPPRSRGEGTAPGDWALWDFAREAPPAPWAVEMGMPARHRDSMSRWMVRRDTSNCSASSGAVILSRWSKMDRMPMSRSIFMGCTAFPAFICIIP